jgi:hypothetical protein
MDNGIKSAPRVNSKEGQESNLSSDRDAAALKPPSDLRHQQLLMDKNSSIVLCRKISSDGRVVKVIICSSARNLSELRTPRQTVNAPSVRLHDER